jgi:hypothetical protein
MGKIKEKCQKNFTKTLQHQISQEHIHWFSKCGRKRHGKRIRTFMQDLSLQICQMGMYSLNDGKDTHALYLQVLHKNLVVATDFIFCGHIYNLNPSQTVHTSLAIITGNKNVKCPAVISVFSKTMQNHIPLC